MGKCCEPAYFQTLQTLKPKPHLLQHFLMWRKIRAFSDCVAWPLPWVLLVRSVLEFCCKLIPFWQLLLIFVAIKLFNSQSYMNTFPMARTDILIGA